MTQSTADVPVCVDLDGTLVATDSLWESLLLVMRDRPATIFRLPGWLLLGKAGFKRCIAEVVLPDVTALPYRQDIVAQLTAHRDAGRRILLTTAADERIANAVASHLGLFDGVAASNGQVNMSGERKVAAIRSLIGTGPFDYYGDGARDLPVFRAARRATVINPSRSLDSHLVDLGAVERIRTPGSRGRAVIRALRVHQWVKNLLLFAPLGLAHEVTNPALILRGIWAFVAFSLCASAIYIVNDLLDVESDRRHTRKRHRPFAAGLLPIPWGLALVPLLLAGAGVVAVITLPTAFLGLLGLYLFITLAYSLHLKRRAVVDVLALAGLYTLRLVAGAVAVGVVFSPWLGAFSMFLFLSLAFVKRYTELLFMEGSRDTWTHGRGYNRGDLEMLRSLGPTSGYLSVLVLALYLSSDVVSVLYGQPFILWLIAPLLLYWITRLWLRAHRGQIIDDPIVATLKDRVTYLIALVAVAVLIVASR